jgi:uncharacterized protein (DUF486 family)
MVSPDGTGKYLAALACVICLNALMTLCAYSHVGYCQIGHFAVKIINALNHQTDEYLMCRFNEPVNGIGTLVFRRAGPEHMWSVPPLSIRAVLILWCQLKPFIPCRF